MDYVVFVAFLGANLGIVSALIYGRAKGRGVASVEARRVLIELWVGAALCFGLLAVAGRLTGGNILSAGRTGQVIGFGAAIVCIGVLLYVLRRINLIISDKPRDKRTHDSVAAGPSSGSRPDRSDNGHEELDASGDRPDPSRAARHGSRG
jgi:hypothetical protein